MASSALNSKGRECVCDASWGASSRTSHRSSPRPRKSNSKRDCGVKMALRDCRRCKSEERCCQKELKYVFSSSILETYNWCPSPFRFLVRYFVWILWNKLTEILYVNMKFHISVTLSVQLCLNIWICRTADQIYVPLWSWKPLCCWHFSYLLGKTSKHPLYYET